MFCDDAHAMLMKHGFQASPNAPAFANSMDEQTMGQFVHDVFGQAERVVLDRSAIAAIDTLAKPGMVERQRAHIVMPAPVTWIEWAGDVPGFAQGLRRQGLLCYASNTRERNVHGRMDGNTFQAKIPDFEHEDGELVREAVVLYFQEYPDLRAGSCKVAGMKFSTLTPGTILRRQPQALKRILATGRDPEGDNWTQFDFDKASAWLGACLCLLATPRVYRKEPADLVKLNKKREAGGKKPFLQYNTVYIDIGKEHVRHVRERDQTEEPAAKGLASRRKQHDVRPFFRLRRGDVELVKYHKRGDPTLGIIKHNFVVRG